MLLYTCMGCVIQLKIVLKWCQKYHDNFMIQYLDIKLMVSWCTNGRSAGVLIVSWCTNGQLVY